MNVHGDEVRLGDTLIDGPETLGTVVHLRHYVSPSMLDLLGAGSQIAVLSDGSGIALPARSTFDVRRAS